MRIKKIVGLSILVAALSPLQSMAAMVAVQNAGFEAISLADGGWSSQDVPGWTITGIAGTFNPSSSSMPGGNTPEGSNMVYIGKNGSLFQALGSTLSENTTYTLNVDIIKRLEYTNSTPYLIELLAGANVIDQDPNTLPVASGTFQTSILSYTALPGDPLLGSVLGIRISSGANQLSFDGVALSSSSIIATPIPAALPLFASALGLMGFTGWRRKKAEK